MKKDYYWDVASEEIWKILIKYIKAEMNICEIGFGSGHFLRRFSDEGYQKLHGIEIRKDQYEKTCKEFEKKKLNIELLNDDVMNMTQKFDAIYSTGLLQCVDVCLRGKMISWLASSAPLGIYVVPEIKHERNIGSQEQIAVAGCVEYSTGNLVWELSQFYARVVAGKIDSKKLLLDDNFLYFICNK